MYFFFFINLTTFSTNNFLISFPQMLGPDNVYALHNLKNAVSYTLYRCVGFHNAWIETEGNRFDEILWIAKHVFNVLII